MSPYSSEELVSRNFVLLDKPDAIINIVDATNIERNLYLTMQLLEMDRPMVVALNMMDELTGNGGTIADFEVAGVEKTDNTHAVATIKVRQKWEDGSFDENSDVEEHKLYMEKVNGQWLISDFDEHKADCIRHIAINKKEQVVRNAISDYLVNEIGEHYQKGELCIPMMIMVHEEDELFMGDFWVLWYDQVGDTLKCVSGGNHAGTMTLKKEGGQYKVVSFEQTVDGAGNEASAQRIFGSYFDIYQNIHSNEKVREAVRQEQLREYVKKHNLNVKYYQDYGWPAVEL